jgi:lysozyme
MIPSSRPQKKMDQVLDLLGEEIFELNPVILVAVRGYYLDSMGKKGVNDRGVYDDAVFVISPTTFTSFNFNVDPSAYRQGIATILPGVHWFRRGRHGISRDRPNKIVSYPAFRPATAGERLPVSRDGESGRSKRDGVATNIHKGSRTSTSSEGCLTVPPNQWEEFYAIVDAEMRRHKVDKFPVILLENTLKGYKLPPDLK